MKQLSTLALFLACVSACSSAPAKPTIAVSVGAILDRTGTNAVASWVDSVEVARTDMNKALETAGSEIRFEVNLADSKNLPSLAVSLGAEMVDAGVKGLVIDSSANTAAMNRVFYDEDTANDYNVPLVCGSCTSGSLNNPAATSSDPITQASYSNSKGWLFRAISPVTPSSIAMAKMLTASGDVNNDGKFKVTIYYSNETFGLSIASQMSKLIKDINSNAIVELVVFASDVDINSYNWSADLAKVTNDRNDVANMPDAVPDAIIVGSFGQYHAAFVRAFKQGNYSIPVMHFQPFRLASVLQSLGALAEGQQGFSHVELDNGPSGEVFAVSLEKKTGVKPAYRDAVYYDATISLMLGTLIAARELEDPRTVTGDQVRQAMRLTSVVGEEVVRTGAVELARAVSLIKAGTPINYEGASSPLDYDALGNTVSRIAFFRVEGGRFVDVIKYDCVADASCPVIP